MLPEVLPSEPEAVFSIRASSGGLAAVRILSTDDLSFLRNVFIEVRPKKPVLINAHSTDIGVLSCTWKKVEPIDGYEMYISTHSEFMANTVRWTFPKDRTGNTVKYLKSGKHYYIKIRTYKNNINGTTMYSNWSSAKKVLIK